MMGKRELVALLSLSSWCLVMVVWLFLAAGLSSVCDCANFWSYLLTIFWQNLEPYLDPNCSSLYPVSTYYIRNQATGVSLADSSHRQHCKIFKYVLPNKVFVLHIIMIGNNYNTNWQQTSWTALRRRVAEVIMWFRPREMIRVASWENIIYAYANNRGTNQLYTSTGWCAHLLYAAWIMSISSYCL